MCLDNHRFTLVRYRVQCTLYISTVYTYIIQYTLYTLQSDWEDDDDSFIATDAGDGRAQEKNQKLHLSEEAMKEMDTIRALMHQESLVYGTDTAIKKVPTDFPINDFFSFDL